MPSTFMSKLIFVMHAYIMLESINRCFILMVNILIIYQFLPVP